jgi:hypothetical protein
LARKLRTRVNPGQKAPIPLELHQNLAALYIDDLRKLANQYGAHPQRWLEQCKSVLGDAKGR